MKALVFSSTKKLIYKTVPKPKLKKNETLIKVLATGICGSDMHAFNGLDKVKKKKVIVTKTNPKISNYFYQSSSYSINKNGKTTRIPPIVGSIVRKKSHFSNLLIISSTLCFF